MSTNKNEVIQKAYFDLAKRQVKWASLVIITAKDTGRVLVVRRRQDGQIGLPCGKQESGEDPNTTAIRELYEETGLHACEMEGPLRYMAVFQFEGTYVSIYTATISNEVNSSPAAGFENETDPFWMSVEELVNTDSHFQSFNIVALNQARLY